MAETVTQPPCRTLAEYVTELVSRLGQEEPSRLSRLREVVGSRRARIRLDKEVVLVQFEGANLVVRDGGDEAPVDGMGSTDRETTLALLAAETELTDAIVSGRLDAHGEVEDLTRIFIAIEILLDASSRSPMLQGLARDFENDPCRATRTDWAHRRKPAPVPVDPDRRPASEHQMLSRLDLLP
jgi:hypothetical protein